jgi:ABC-type spermidine/putrescine transport system permease subunit II
MRRLSPALLLQLASPPSMLALSILSWTLPISLMAEAGKQAETSLISLLDSLSRHIPVIDQLMTRYNPFAWFDTLLWVSILAGRMLPIAWVLMAMVARSLPANLAEQAAVDGADRWHTLQRILLPLLAPAAAAAWLICSLLVATDTVAASMLQPAGFQVLAVSLLNQMHYGRDGDIVATCLMMLAMAAAAATVAALTLGKAASDRMD